jgi:hypothetical protein
LFWFLIFFVWLWYKFCGWASSTAIPYIPPVLASSRCQRINVSLYYYLKGIFIFLLSILRWKYAVWRSTSVVYKKLVWTLIGMCNVTSRNSINLKCKSLWNEATFWSTGQTCLTVLRPHNGAWNLHKTRTMYSIERNGPFNVGNLDIEAELLFGFLVCIQSHLIVRTFFLIVGP